MKHPVIAIGLDSAEPELIEKWMSEGHLKNLASLKQQGAYGRLVNMEYYKGESAWTNFLTGCLPHKTGYWSKFNFNPQTYEPKVKGSFGAYDYKEIPPFYALGDKYRVAMFDMPQTTISDKVNGIQVVAWGAHAPMIHRKSQPENLVFDLVKQYGDHPADTLNHRDRSDWYNTASVEKLRKDLEVGLERRTAITKDLLSRERWDFFLTDIGETHTAQHYFWHLSQPSHPLYKLTADPNHDPLLEYFEAVDRSLGEMLAAAPEDAQVLVFSVHGQGDNSTDILSMVVLSEFLYRFSFPGKYMVKSQPMGSPLGDPQAPPNTTEGWYKQLPNLKYESESVKLRKDILKGLEPILPGKIHRRLAKLMGMAPPPMSYHPTSWYHKYWSQMKAFALPGFSDGYIRINLKGRESKGVVSLAEYDAVCNELIAQLHQLVDARTGEPVVKEVIRTRENPMDTNPKLPDADLAVIWGDNAVDTVDSPKYGRIGPIFFNRTGAHRARGFVVAKGPGIEAGSTLTEAHAIDLAPTILELMGAPIPEYMDGKPLLKTKVLV
ncbi:alkaline phosphatase family protein [Aerosakkonemataceae cyanobacterium BLCC-F154]|uniref:Alkaline phosphatase family protein n=1 Tax=Floridaenema fluviatile BLCC-F154 TaxID=3153640 RepID=A0ABV4YIG2_9CYAN